MAGPTEHLVDLGGPPPQDLEAFVALRDRLATTPEGGAAVFVAALCAYAQDPVAGLAHLTVAIDLARLDKGSAGYKGYQPGRADQQAFKERVAAKPFLARSYVQGTSPENGYAIPDQALVKVRDQGLAGESSAETAKRFVHSTGADSPRPLVLKKNNRGLWKADAWSSLTVGVRAPVQVVDDDL